MTTTQSPLLSPFIHPEIFFFLVYISTGNSYGEVPCPSSFFNGEISGEKSEMEVHSHLSLQVIWTERADRQYSLKGKLHAEI